MPYVKTALDAALLTKFNADATMLLAKQRLEDASAIEWRQSGSFASGSNETDADFPTFLADDRKAYADTRPDSSQTLWHVLIQFPTALKAKINAWAMFGHNFGSNSATVSLQIANNNAYTTDLVTLRTVIPANDNRIIELVLDDAAPAAPVSATEYTQVEFARLLISAGGGFIPRIGELWFGERVQFSEPVLRDFKPDKTLSDAPGSRTRGGTLHRIIHWFGAAAPEPRIYLDDQVDVDAAIKFLRDTREGNDPFVFIAQPKTHPEQALLVNDLAQGDSIAYVIGTENEQSAFFDISNIVENEPFLVLDV